jgi:hypothetical protein
MNQATTPLATEIPGVRPHDMTSCPAGRRSRREGTRKGGRMVRRMVLLAMSVLTVLFTAAGLANASVYNSMDTGYWDGELGVGSTSIQCFTNLHRAYFTFDVTPTFGYESGPQSLGVKLDAYRWNGRQYVYYSTSGWYTDNNDNHLTWSTFGGVQSGYWIHHVYYRWMEPNGTWTTLDEWIGSYQQEVYHPSTGTYTYYTAPYCST